MNHGLFWVIEGQLLAIPFNKSIFPEAIAKSGNTYNHKKLWPFVKPQTCNKPYDYYPRGRVQVNKRGVAYIYLNPSILAYVTDVIDFFELEPNTFVKVDNSSHYQYQREE